MLELVPISFKEATEFVNKYHRKLSAPKGHKFSIAVSNGIEIVGVAMVGRPVSRHLDNGFTLEVNRVCTKGDKNSCSMLYGAAWRAAKALGYNRIITYIFEDEDGTSLVASGWKCVAITKKDGWNTPARSRVEIIERKRKKRFEPISDFGDKR